jgi:hypothetical protein
MKRTASKTTGRGPKTLSTSCLQLGRQALSVKRIFSDVGCFTNYSFNRETTIFAGGRENRQVEPLGRMAYGLIESLPMNNNWIGGSNLGRSTDSREMIQV